MQNCDAVSVPMLSHGPLFLRMSMQNRDAQSRGCSSCHCTIDGCTTARYPYNDILTIMAIAVVATSMHTYSMYIYIRIWIYIETFYVHRRRSHRRRRAIAISVRSTITIMTVVMFAGQSVAVNRGASHEITRSFHVG